MSWLPTNLVRNWALESASVNQSSSAKTSRSRLVGWAVATVSTTAPWNRKSSVEGNGSSVEKRDRNAGLPSNTSPKIGKSGLPCAAANACTAGTNCSHSSSLTCLTVSTRKPSTSNVSIIDVWMSIIPSTTVGCSVNRSSRPTKSPYSEFSPVNVEFAPVVVQGAVVEPGGHLGVGVRRRVVGRRVGEARLRIERRERVAAGVVAVVELDARRVHVREVGLVAVRRLVAFVVRDDVGGVVDDDVEVDLHAAPVGVVDEVDHLGVAAEVGVDLRVVGLPVAVVARRRALHPAVGERRRDPQRRHAHVLEVAEARAQSGEVAAVVPALAGRVVAVHGPVAGGTALVVGVRAVGEAVGHHEVDDLVGRRRADRQCRARARPARP